MIFEESFTVTSVALFIADFNLLSCELDKCPFRLYYGYTDHLGYIESFYTGNKSKKNKFTIFLRFREKNPRWFALHI